MNSDIFMEAERLIRSVDYAKAEPTRIKQILEGLDTIANGPHSADASKAKEYSSKLREATKPASSFLGSTTTNLI